MSSQLITMVPVSDATIAAYKRQSRAEQKRLYAAKYRARQQSRWSICVICKTSFQGTSQTCKRAACHGALIWNKRGRRSLEERFWRFVDKTPGQGPWGDCWGWSGSTCDGYGQLGSGIGHIPIRASVLSYKLHFGDIPDGLLVCHDCDNPPCTNPHHLIADTHANNLSEGAARRREAELAALTVSLSSLPHSVSALISGTPVDRHYLDQALNRLGDRERRIITARFGLDGEELTLEEVGAEFGFSRERARQIEAGALIKLRKWLLAIEKRRR